MKLTKKAIDGAKHPESGQVFLRDDEIKGLAVRVTAGSKSFVLERWIHGRVRRLTLGRFGDITLEQARGLAREKIGDIAKGQDPAEARRAQRRSVTWHELETLYLERHAVLKKSRSNDERILNTHVAHWRPRRLSAITRADVYDVHTRLGAAGHPVGANGVVRIVRAMFNKAKEWGVLEGENPAAKVKLFREIARDRFVLPTELPRLWQAIQGEPNPFVKAALVTALLTGARRGEVLRMRWGDVDVEAGIWRLPMTKSGQPHVVPLPAPVRRELAALPRFADNEFVFCGRRTGEPLFDLKGPWQRIRKEARLDDVRIHDLRRTLGSWLVSAGASLPLIGKALNHSRPETTQIYARLQIEPVRQALEDNAATMLAVIGAAQQRGAS
jgi:site-specific recombinase XerD